MNYGINRGARTPRAGKGICLNFNNNGEGYVKGVFKINKNVRERKSRLGYLPSYKSYNLIMTIYKVLPQCTKILS